MENVWVILRKILNYSSVCWIRIYAVLFFLKLALAISHSCQIERSVESVFLEYCSTKSNKYVYKNLWTYAERLQMAFIGINYFDFTHIKWGNKLFNKIMQFEHFLKSLHELLSTSLRNEIDKNIWLKKRKIIFNKL